MPARVVGEHRGGYLVRSGLGDRLARARGRLRDDELWGGMPAVGDWVVVCDAPGERFAIEALLPRRTKVSRKTPWLKAEEHILVANVDTVLIVSGLDADFNPRRLERYLTAAWDSGADPVLVLTKLDVCDEPGVLLRPRRTFVLLGSSGVGKSTLINRLAGRRLMPTGDLSRDGRGRHTTRHRQLLVLPGGALVVDTPGLRELQVWEGDVDSAFADVAELASQCRFNDCGHATEPDCAVQAALATGALDADRYASYLKLQRELRSIEVRSSARLQREAKQRWRARARESRAVRRYRERLE